MGFDSERNQAGYVNGFSKSKWWCQIAMLRELEECSSSGDTSQTIKYTGTLSFDNKAFAIQRAATISSLYGNKNEEKLRKVQAEILTKFQIYLVQILHPSVSF